jgi:hypothetical protein
MEEHFKQAGEALRFIQDAVMQNVEDRNMYRPGPMSAEYEQDEHSQWNDEGKMGYGGPGGPDAKKRRGVSCVPVIVVCSC